MMDDATQPSTRDAQTSESTVEEELDELAEDVGPVDNQHPDDSRIGESDTEGAPPLAPALTFQTLDDSDIVEVNVAVDTSDMGKRETEVLRVLADQFEDAFREIYEKNRDYDWSFLTSGSKLASSKGSPFDHPSRSQAFGLLTRTGDKRERLVENVFGDGEAAVSDTPSTTALETANYYHFLAFVLANPRLAAGFPKD